MTRSRRGVGSRARSPRFRSAAALELRVGSPLDITRRLAARRTPAPTTRRPPALRVEWVSFTIERCRTRTPRRTWVNAVRILKVLAIKQGLDGRTGEQPAQPRRFLGGSLDAPSRLVIRRRRVTSGLVHSRSITVAIRRPTAWSVVVLPRRIPRAGARFEAVLADPDCLGVFFELPDTLGVPPKVHEFVDGTTLTLLECQASRLKRGRVINSLVVRMGGMGSAAGVVQCRIRIQRRRFLVQVMRRECLLVWPAIRGRLSMMLGTRRMMTVVVHHVSRSCSSRSNANRRANAMGVWRRRLVRFRARTC